MLTDLHRTKKGLWKVVRLPMKTMGQHFWQARSNRTKNRLWRIQRVRSIRTHRNWVTTSTQACLNSMPKVSRELTEAIKVARTGTRADTLLTLLWSRRVRLSESTIRRSPSYIKKAAMPRCWPIELLEAILMTLRLWPLLSKIVAKTVCFSSITSRRRAIISIMVTERKICCY